MVGASTHPEELENVEALDQIRLLSRSRSSPPQPAHQHAITPTGSPKSHQTQAAKYGHVDYPDSWATRQTGDATSHSSGTMSESINALSPPVKATRSSYL